MPRIACIVEGHGDALSIPVILRRIAALAGVHDLTVVGPYRVSRQRIVRAGELERAIERAARTLRSQGGGSIIVLLDADDDSPCVLGPALQARAVQARADLRSRVVLANKEKEAWYLASLESLRGRRGIPEDAEPPAAPEAIRGAKERLSRLLGRPYSEVADQTALAAQFDVALARERAASFDKFARDVISLLG